ncbi:hypothetical protein SAMN04488700_0517 [Carnobacterium iners]|uniref:ABC-2 family transporter protein n=1 Tax=Carnobacterium iners TaxID=1073423 RepID=A0A1X7MR74_9LACT|nr:hypothetical protein [Carnobacterium iners]SEL01346.1 hypothetical protein SAMN04488114_12034 [Carnobacterium iners]SMH27195.1 hypothetical protein SAMN04488700_0517 [Carnobacterium iners]
MKNYLKLVYFELNRFIKIYMALIVVTVISQFTGVFLQSRNYVATVSQTLQQESLSIKDYFASYPPLTFINVTLSGWFIIPIIFSAAALVFYSFFIWYRDWFGKNAFIYRLLMLPTDRINLFFSKLTAIILMVLGLVATQLILIPFESALFNQLLPDYLRYDLSTQTIISSSEYLSVLFPNSFIQFLIHYGLGLLVLIVLFTIILFERSFHLKGLVFGGLFGAGMLILMLSPFIIQAKLNPHYLYPIEIFAIELFLGLTISIFSIWVSYYLLNKKITV